MARTRDYYVYILTNRSDVLYVGVTNNLQSRLFQHASKATPGFTSKYNVSTLVYYDVTHDVQTAITREKQIKGWKRAKKIALIESQNPHWRDLGEAL